MPGGGILGIAVTAASGRLGQATLRALAARTGAGDVLAVARRPEAIAVPGIRRRAADYGSVESMTAALDGVHTVVMISAPVNDGTDRPQLHRNVIEAARRAGVSAMICTSVVGNDKFAGTLFEPVLQENRQTEEDVRNSGLDWVIARNGLYLDLDLRHIVAAAGSGIYSNPAGEGRAPYISIDEIAYATAQLATTPGHYGNLYRLTGQCVTQAELVALANQVFGLDIRYEAQVDEENTTRLLRLTPERGAQIAQMLTGVFQCIRNGAMDVPSSFRAAAGREPRPLRQMMEDCRRKLEWAQA